MGSWLSIRLRGGVGSALVRLVLCFIAMLFAAGCAPPRPPYREIHVCARPPVIPANVGRWSVSNSGTFLWKARELDIERPHGAPFYVFDAHAPETTLWLLPIPYNKMKCPPPPPPRPVASKIAGTVRKAEAKKDAAPEETKKAVVAKAPPQPIQRPPAPEEAHRTRVRVVVRQVREAEATTVTTTTAARPEVRCPQRGQVRRRTGTAQTCRPAMSVGPRSTRRIPRGATGEEQEEKDEPAPAPQPQRAEGPLEDWNVREPEVGGLSAERAMECLANLCHARHPGFAPKKKGGSGKAAGPREGQAWSSGGKAPPSGGGKSTTVKTTTRPVPAKPNGAAAGQAGAPTIRNKHLAGQKHPKTGVPFDAEGYPDFKAAGVVKKEVKIVQTGNRRTDKRDAYKAAELEPEKDYIWHHHQDGKTMQLVPAKIHRDTGHTGGVATQGGP